MLDKVTILGEYLSKDPQGTWIGGKEFKPGKVLEVAVTEETYLTLLIAQENGWFKIKKDNYDDFLKSRNRVVITLSDAVKPALEPVAAPVLEPVLEPVAPVDPIKSEPEQHKKKRK